MASTEASTNGEIDQSQHQSGNDAEESMEIQNVQNTSTVESDSVQNTSSKSNIPYDDFKLFVGGLNTETNKSTLEKYFSHYGTVSEVNLKIDEVTKRSRGFAFILFEEKDAVDKILQDGQHTIDGKVIDSRKAIPHEIHQQLKQRTKKIFVGGVPTDMSEQTIRDYFEKFGPIEEVALVTEKGEERKRRGFCFVTFKSEDTADEVCSQSFHKIEQSEVEVKRATPREQDKKGYGGGHHFSGRGGGRGNPQFYHHHGEREMQPHFAPYGGHAAYYPYYPPTPGYPGGGYMGGYGSYGGGYGGYGSYDQYGGGRRDDAGYNSRYGPMRSYTHHNHSHGHSGSSFHPYSR